MRTWSGVGSGGWARTSAISDTGTSGWGEAKSAGSEMYWRTESHSELSMVAGESKEEEEEGRAT